MLIDCEELRGEKVVEEEEELGGKERKMETSIPESSSRSSMSEAGRASDTCGAAEAGTGADGEGSEACEEGKEEDVHLRRGIKQSELEFEQSVPVRT